MADRQYVVGVPLIVVVDDEGSVTYEVDTSEISQEMSERFGEGDEDWSEDQMLLDGAIVDAQRNEHQVVVTHPAGWLGAVECPVRYACKFSTRDLSALADHIRDFDHSDADKF